MEDTKASNQHWYEAVPKPTMFRQTLVKPQKKFEKKHTRLRNLFRTSK